MIKRYGYHVVLTTHNSRTSKRMIKYRVRKGPAILLTLEEEIILTQIISEIIQENSYRCVAYNICRDHVHLLLVCPEGTLNQIIQKLKSISSKLFHRSPKIKSHLPAEHKNHLWSQKFYRASLNEWQLANLSNAKGEVYRSNHLINSERYIRTNRKKHGLPESEQLQQIISDFVMSIDDAFNGS